MSPSGAIFDTTEAVYVAPGGVAPPPTPLEASPWVASAPNISGPRSLSDAMPEGPSHAGGDGDAPSSRIYNRILIKPDPVTVGHVTDTVQRTGIIWNTKPAEDITLQQILPTGDQGIALAGIQPLDLIRRLKDVSFTYTVTTDGPISISALFRYLFDAGEVSHTILGSRGVVILTRPLVRGYSETRAFDSTLFRTSNGKDYVESNLEPGDPPRTLITFPVSSLTKGDLARLENVLLFGAQYAVGVPLWFSLSRLTTATDGGSIVYCPTEMRRFNVGDNVVLMSSAYPRIEDFALRLVEEVTETSIVLNAPVDANAFAAGDFILPIKKVAVENEYTFNMRSLPNASGTLTFEEVEQ